MQSCSEVNFTYEFMDLDNFDEGLEVAFCNLNGQREWIPIWFYSQYNLSVRSMQDISLGKNINSGYLTLRGYYVNYTVVKSDPNSTQNEANIRLCGSNVFSNETHEELFNWQFRWQQSVAMDDENDTDGDIIHIDNVKIAVVNETSDKRPIMLFEDDFQTGLLRYIIVIKNYILT